MTVGKLEKLLAKIKYKRMQVCVDRDSLWTGNGTFNICYIQKADAECIERVDDDGFLAYTKKGEGRVLTLLILKGHK